MSFYKNEFVQLVFIIKSETSTLTPHLPNSYINQVSCTIQLDLYPLLSLLASFLKIFWQPFSVSYGQFAQVKNCYFYLGKLIHFKIKMSLPIDYLS